MTSQHHGAESKHDTRFMGILTLTEELVEALMCGIPEDTWERDMKGYLTKAMEHKMNVKVVKYGEWQFANVGQGAYLIVNGTPAEIDIAHSFILGLHNSADQTLLTEMNLLVCSNDMNKVTKAVDVYVSRLLSS